MLILTQSYYFYHMNFLDKVYFDNTVLSYLIVGGIILLIFLFKKYISQVIATFIFRGISRMWPSVQKQHFFELVITPMGRFIAVVISVFALDKLYFPKAFKYQLYGHDTADIFERLGKGVIIIAFTWLVLRLVDFIARVLELKASLTADTRDDQLVVFFRDFLKVLVGIAGVLLIIKACFHQSIGNVLTGLSIVGAALALAAKESLENLIASFIIFFDKPFFTGDTVKVNTVTGTVEKIGLRSTRIRTGDKTLVTVPNKQMVDSVVDNWSLRTERRAEIRLELASSTSAEALEKFNQGIKNIIQQQGNKISTYNVFVREISKTGIVIIAEFFTAPYDIKEFFQLNENINYQVKKLMEENSIEFAGDSNTIIVKDDQRNK